MHNACMTTNVIKRVTLKSDNKSLKPIVSKFSTIC